MRVKICGIRYPDQGQAIAELGIKTLGFICVACSPRYVTPTQIRAVIQVLPAQTQTVGVFANATLEEIQGVITQTGLTAIQLHGQESPEFCQRIKQQFGDRELIKALRIGNPENLQQAESYIPFVDTLLLDAYHPEQLGGTGQTLPWEKLQQFSPTIPWLLAGGLNPNNVLTALNLLRPDGIDLSSGVERSPGDKDIAKIQQLVETLQKRSEFIGKPS